MRSTQCLPDPVAAAAGLGGERSWLDQRPARQRQLCKHPLRLGRSRTAADAAKVGDCRSEAIAALPGWSWGAVRGLL